MSLEKIDQYISQLEAVKNYDSMKKERDAALTLIDRLKNELEAQKQRVEDLESLRLTTKDTPTIKEAEKIFLESKEKGDFNKV